MICGECGRETPERYSRGPLTVETEPLRIYHKGLPLDLPPMQARMLAALVETGKASFLRLDIAADTESDGSVKVEMCRLRQRLPTGVEIRAVRGWGYEVMVEDGAELTRSAIHRSASRPERL